jgi:hypothetical protein
VIVPGLRGKPQDDSQYLVLAERWVLAHCSRLGPLTRARERSWVWHANA